MNYAVFIEKVLKKIVFSKNFTQKCLKGFFSHKTKNRNKFSQVNIIFSINLQNLNFCKQNKILKYIQKRLKVVLTLNYENK